MEKEFYEIAKEFNEYISNTIITKKEIVTLISKVTNLYLLANSLPNVKAEEEIDYHTEIPSSTIRVGEDIKDRYWLIFDPYDKDSEVSTTISDDLEDITRDLNKGIIEYEKGHINNAIFVWRDNYSFHWGDHVTNLLKVLNKIRNDMYINGEL
jgi:hypothetical protein